MAKAKENDIDDDNLMADEDVARISPEYVL
jgi:hypothetical protein